MQNTLKWCLVSVTASCALTLGAVSLLRPAAPAAPLSEELSAAAEQEDYQYLIKDFNGRIAVYAKGEKAPNMVFDVYTNQLPKADEEALRDGVRVESYEALMLRIEDYIS